MDKPSKETLETLYFKEKKSPEKIGLIYDRNGRTIRGWMYSYGIKLLGPTHLITGKTAPWNKVKSEREQLRLRTVNVGRIPHNKGKGNISFICEVCGTDVSDKPYRRKRTCSKLCRDELNHLLRGTKHWNFNGEGVANHQRQRLWALGREWRTKVLTRDNFICAACPSRKRMVAHHLDGWANHPDKRFDLGNGITLCHDCHWRFHREVSHKNATADSFWDWLRRLKEQPAST